MEKKTTHECAVHAFQHPLLRLSHCGKRARNKANRRWSHLIDRRSDRVPGKLHHQRCGMRSMGLPESPSPHLTGFAMNFFLRNSGCHLRLDSCRSLLDQRCRISCHLRSGSPHCSCLLRGIHCRFLCQRLRNERDEDPRWRQAFLSPCHLEYGSWRKLRQPYLLPLLPWAESFQPQNCLG